MATISAGILSKPQGKLSRGIWINKKTGLLYSPVPRHRDSKSQKQLIARNGFRWATLVGSAAYKSVIKPYSPKRYGRFTPFQRYLRYTLPFEIYDFVPMPMHFLPGDLPSLNFNVIGEWFGVYRWQITWRWQNYAIYPPDARVLVVMASGYPIRMRISPPTLLVSSLSWVLCETNDWPSINTNVYLQVIIGDGKTAGQRSIPVSVDYLMWPLAFSVI